MSRWRVTNMGSGRVLILDLWSGRGELRAALKLETANRHCGPAISSLRGEHVMIGASTFQTCDSCRCISPEVSKDLRILPQRQLHLAALRVACQSWGVSELTLTQSSEQSFAIVWFSHLCPRMLHQNCTRLPGFWVIGWRRPQERPPSTPHPEAFSLLLIDTVVLRFHHCAENMLWLELRPFKHATLADAFHLKWAKTSGFFRRDSCI